MSNELIPYENIEKMAIAVSKSGLFGMNTPEQALSLMLLAQSEGIHPMTAARDYHIINNRPALKADAMLARFQKSGGIVRWLERTDSRVAGEFSHPQCPDPVVIDWDMERAIKAGVGTRDNWKKYPRQMLTARVVSEGVRATYPASCSSVYTPEEVQDFEPIGKPVVSMPQPKQPVKPQETAQEAVIVEKPTTEAVKPVEVPFSPVFAKKALASIEKSIGKEAFDQLMADHGFKSVDDIKTKEQFDMFSLTAWKIRKQQKAVKNGNRVQ